MTIKDVINKKPNQNAAIPWWAYLLGAIGLGLVGGSVALIVWLVKRKNQKKNKNPEELELKEVKVIADQPLKVIADQPRQTQKVENIPKPKEEEPTKEPKAVPEKKEKVKPNKPKLVLERSKDEEVPESLETISVPSGKMAKIWDKERVIVEADRQEKLRKLKEKRKAKADKRWEDDKSWYEENSKYLKEEMTQRSDDELAKDVLHFAAYLYKTKKISKNFYNKLSSRFCFQNRHVAEEDEWKMLSVSTAEGALICQRL
uniref:Uncharacterized protein n=1 Tax=Panagrolaimus sp. JU765 TaxID=591449 RepID=A0AC34RDZ8_9BILA